MSGKTRKEQIEAMLAEDPNDAFLHYGLAMECVSQGNDEEAIRCFEDLARLNPDYVAGHHQRGQVLARLGRIEEARAVLRTGIEAARAQRNDHAAGEMEGLLDSLD